MPEWRPTPETVINDIPIGVPQGEAPFADVDIGFEEGRHRGVTLGFPEERVLFLSHSIQCRTVRELERLLNNSDKRPIDERMLAHHIGYGRQQVESSVEAVRVLAGTSASTFDRGVARSLSALRTDDARRGYFSRVVWTAQILRRAHQDARYYSVALRQLRRSNLDRSLRPRHASLQAAILPARLIVHDRPEIASELLIIALAGLVNPAHFYREFDYLGDPLDLLTWIGWVGLYGRTLDPRAAVQLHERMAEVSASSPPACVRDCPHHEQMYRGMCGQVERAWSNLNMDAIMRRAA